MRINVNADLDQVRAKVERETRRVAVLGNWGSWSSDALSLRLPTASSLGMGGMDAGVACALDLIPRSQQKLSAQLHAAWSPEAVAVARKESVFLSGESMTGWWLAACDVCVEGSVDAATFRGQLVQMQEVRLNPVVRAKRAQNALESMRSSFEVRDGVAWGNADGCMQGAYLAGHDVAVMHAEAYGLWFVGTYLPSLHVEDLEWEEPGDPSSPELEKQRGRSGPVHGSTQFVKAASLAEVERILARAQG